MEIYVSAWSLHATMRRSNLSLFDLPGFIRRHGFEGLELSDRQILGHKKDDLQNFAQCCKHENLGTVFDVNSDLTFSDQSHRKQEIDHVKQMLNMAQQLGATCVRVCLGGQSFSIQKLLGKHRIIDPERDSGSTLTLVSRTLVKMFLLKSLALHFAHIIRKNMPSHVKDLEPKMRRAMDSLEEIIKVAARYEIPLGIENHWGISSRPENILRVIEEIDSPWLGTCPDFGNFPRDVNPYDGLMALAPKALLVHAKSSRFDEDGEEKEIDYERCMNILRESGYDAVLTVEYDGRGDDLEGCLLTRKLILKYW